MPLLSLNAFCLLNKNRVNKDTLTIKQCKLWATVKKYILSSTRSYWMSNFSADSKNALIWKYFRYKSKLKKTAVYLKIAKNLIAFLYYMHFFLGIKIVTIAERHIYIRTMVLILDSSSLIGAHVRRNLYYSTCLRYLIRSRAVTI